MVTFFVKNAGQPMAHKLEELVTACVAAVGIGGNEPMKMFAPCETALCLGVQTVGPFLRQVLVQEAAGFAQDAMGHDPRHELSLPLNAGAQG